MIFPWHSHIPDPKFINLIQCKAVFLDVGTLLRGAIFPESHSRRLLEHIERSADAEAIISPHIRNTALTLLENHYPLLKERFSSEYLLLTRRHTIKVVDDGHPKILPSEVLFDEDDDDIVMASAVKAKCDYLATLDFRLAGHASQVIEILSPSQPELSEFIPTTSSLPPSDSFYATPRQGSIMIEVAASGGSTSYHKHGGRRYVFCTDNGFSCWLNEDSWRFEIGNSSSSEPLIIFEHVDPTKATLITASYNCDKSSLQANLSQLGHSENKTIKDFTYPDGIGGNWSILSDNNGKSFNGNWRGILTTAMSVGKKAMKYAVKHKHHFMPLDCQRFPLVDSIMEPALVIIPENSHNHMNKSLLRSGYPQAKNLPKVPLL